MGGTYGVQGTKEVLTLCQVVAVAIIEQVKKDGGFHVTDLGAFLKSPDFEAAIAPVVADFALVPKELTELDVFDGIALARAGYDLVQAVVTELKK